MVGLYRFRTLSYSTSILLIIAAILALRVQLPLCKAQQLRCSFDQCLSPYARATIKAYLLTHNAPFDTAFIATLTQQFPWIETINLSIDPTKGRLSLTARKPYARLNETEIIDKDGFLWSRTLYTKECTNAIPLITTKEPLNGTAGKSIAQFLAHIPHEIFAFYQCTLINPTTIALTDHAQFSIILSTNSILTEKLLRECLYIKSTLARNKTLHKGYIVDARFNGSLILRKKGGSHGSSLL